MLLYIHTVTPASTASITAATTTAITATSTLLTILYVILVNLILVKFDQNRSELQHALRVFEHPRSHAQLCKCMQAGTAKLGSARGVSSPTQSCTEWTHAQTLTGPC